MSLIRITGSQLHVARVLVGLSREEVAERAGLCRHSIRKWETTSDTIPAATYSHLCRVVDVLEGEDARYSGDGVSALCGDSPDYLMEAMPEPPSRYEGFRKGQLKSSFPIIRGLAQSSHGSSLPLGPGGREVWDDAGDNIVDHVAGVDDFETAVATYRAACLRWPKAKITLRQGARVVVKNWWNGK